MTFDKVDMMIY